MTQPVSLKVSRLIKAPRERVFAAWTNPADLHNWMGGEGCNVHSAKVDLRVGGEYKIVADCGDHGVNEMKGVYREIKSPERLVFTWDGGCHPDMKGKDIETLVTVELIDKKGATEVTITHEGFPSDDSCASHNYGWTASLEKLEKFMA
jgi:uncharacterized protein YndB with AHSA1/START domain